MNLSDIRTQLEDLYGNAFASSATYYNRIINNAYKKICSQCDWWWLQGASYFDPFQVTTLDDTEQISATNGSADVTTTTTTDLSSGLADGYLYSDSNFYRIDSVTQTATNGYTITLKDAWRGDTDSYDATIYNPWKQLPSDALYVLDVLPLSKSTYPPLTHFPMEQIRGYSIRQSDSETEHVLGFAVEPDTSGNLWLRLWPPPSDEQTFKILYRKQAATLETDSTSNPNADTPQIPVQYHTVLVDAAKVELLKNEGEDDSRIRHFEVEVGKGVSMMRKEQTARGKVRRRPGRFGLRGAEKTVGYKLENISPYQTY